MLAFATVAVALAWSMYVRDPSPASRMTIEPLAWTVALPKRPVADRMVPPPSEAAEDGLEPPLELRSITVRRGDTLMKLLLDNGVPAPQAHLAVTSLREIYDPRGLRIGQEITLIYRPGIYHPGNGAAAAPKFEGLLLDAAIDREVSVLRDGADSFAAAQKLRPLVRRLTYLRGRIEASLFVSAKAAGVPVSVVLSMIRLFSFDTDLQRDLRPGDGFEVLYERFNFEDGGYARDGEVVHAALTLSGRRLALYRFSPRAGAVDYYDASGQSVRKALMRTPIDGARLSSRFGKRRHPIKGYTRMHRGVDFAAPKGTPIYAAGDGVVTRGNRNGSYGKYIRIRHNSTYSTAYAHLSRIAKGIGRRKRVRQGQVIGYVGSTGASTGPHLHYEILRQGRQINPLAVEMPPGEKLRGAELAAFKARHTEIERRIAELADAGYKVAHEFTPPPPAPPRR